MKGNKMNPQPPERYDENTVTPAQQFDKWLNGGTK